MSGGIVSFSVCCKAQNTHVYFLFLHGKETVLLDESSGHTQARKLETRLQTKQVAHQQEKLLLNLPRENPVLHPTASASKDQQMAFSRKQNIRACVSEHGGLLHGNT